MRIKINNILINYHLFLTGLSFLIFSIFLFIDSISYFVGSKFFEGFMLVGQVFVFDVVIIALIVPYLMKGDFEKYIIAIIFGGIVTGIGFSGFKLPFAVLPPLTLGVAAYFLITANNNHG